MFGKRNQLSARGNGNGNGNYLVNHVLVTNSIHQPRSHKKVNNSVFQGVTTGTNTRRAQSSNEELKNERYRKYHNLFDFALKFCWVVKNILQEKMKRLRRCNIILSKSRG